MERREFFGVSGKFLFGAYNFLNSPGLFLPGTDSPVHEITTVADGINKIKVDFEMDVDTSEYTPTIKMVQTLYSALDQVPNPGCLVQRVNFSRSRRDVLAIYSFDANTRIGMVTIFHDPERDLSAKNPEWISLGGRIVLPDAGTLLLHTIVHEIGHGFAARVLYLSCPDITSYLRRKETMLHDSNNPIFRTFAQIAGFDFIKEPSAGWIRKRDVRGQMQVSRYEAEADINEAFAEYFRAWFLAPEILTPEARIYFRNIFRGLSSDDPNRFLQEVADNPERVLFKEIDKAYLLPNPQQILQYG